MEAFSSTLPPEPEAASLHSSLLPLELGVGRAMEAFSSTSLEACQCQRSSSYRTIHGCAPCPRGADCSKTDDLHVDELLALPGFWRASNESDYFSDCRQYHATVQLAVERCSVDGGRAIG